MTTHLKSETEPVKCRFEVGGVIDENGRLGARHLLFEFSEKQHRSFGGSRLKQPHVEELVRLGIDGSVQPVAFVVALDHGLVDRDVIRLPVTGWLDVGLLHPVVDRCPAPLDTQLFEKLFGIRK
jgi:hypothetical protein